MRITSCLALGFMLVVTASGCSEDSPTAPSPSENNGSGITNYTFSADPQTASGSDPTLVSLLTGLSPMGTLIYDNSVAQTGTAPERSSSTGAASYFGSLTNLVGSVNGMSFSDPIGRIRVGDERFEPTGLTDAVILSADTRRRVDLVGFEIGGYVLTNVRMFWIEGRGNGIPDFLSSQALPTVLPSFEGLISFAFALRTDPNIRVNVSFERFRVLRFSG